MDKKSTTVIVLVSISVCSIFVFVVFMLFAHFGSRILKKSRISNRKQFSRKKVVEELHHNVRYNTPDSLPVSLAPVQPRSSRRQTLPAISLCRLNGEFSPKNTGQTSYGSIELIRSKVRRYSEVGFSRPEPIEKCRKISLDSEALSRICEESTEMYEYESSRSRRGSTASYIDKDSTSHSEIDVDLYSSTDDMSSQSTTSGCGLGRLYFIVNFNKSLGNLYVTIVKASYVRSTVVKETCCVYIKVTLLDSLCNYPVQRSNCVTSMGNPMFNQTFTFHITSIPEQLQLTVKEVRKLESNRVIGYVWFDLCMLKDNHSMLLSQEISREIFGENKLFRRRGDVLINLKIVIHDAIEIHVCVAEARNLVVRNQNISVYVRASLLIKHKVTQTKKGQPVKRSISSPSFNDRFKFIIPNSKDISILDECCIMLCFCSRSRVRFSHLIGRCIIGNIQYTEGEGLLQWTESISKPGLSVSQWLSLT